VHSCHIMASLTSLDDSALDACSFVCCLSIADKKQSGGVSASSINQPCLSNMVQSKHIMKFECLTKGGWGAGRLAATAGRECR
jgi:hypothetical protein